MLMPGSLIFTGATIMRKVRARPMRPAVRRWGVGIGRRACLASGGGLFDNQGGFESCHGIDKLLMLECEGGKVGSGRKCRIVGPVEAGSRSRQLVVLNGAFEVLLEERHGLRGRFKSAPLATGKVEESSRVDEFVANKDEGGIAERNAATGGEPLRTEELLEEVLEGGWQIPRCAEGDAVGREF